MAITVIKRTKDKDEHNIPYLMFESKEIEIVPYGAENPTTMWMVTVTPVDEELKAMGEYIRYELPKDEESFHKLLRLEANERKTLEKKYCTDPEWNPNYKNNNK
tara:strand:- start:599 stop:910 length:312 start_codon:yes stop_codon:yes gene_type:complete